MPAFQAPQAGLAVRKTSRRSRQSPYCCSSPTSRDLPQRTCTGSGSRTARGPARRPGQPCGILQRLAGILLPLPRGLWRMVSTLARPWYFGHYGCSVFGPWHNYCLGRWGWGVAGRWIGEYFCAMLDQTGSLTSRETADRRCWVRQCRDEAGSSRLEGSANFSYSMTLGCVGRI